VLVDVVLQAEDVVDPFLDVSPIDLGILHILPDGVAVAGQHRRGVWIVCKHPEPLVVREEVRVGLDVRDDGLLVGEFVRLLEKRVGRVVVVDDFERLPAEELALLLLAVVLHPQRQWGSAAGTRRRR